MAEDADETAGGRRRLLVIAAATCTAAAFGAAFVPGLGVLAPRGAEGGRPWIRTLRLDALPDGAPRRVMLVADARDAWTVAKDTELGAAWLVRSGAEVRAYSAACPHLGCAIDAKASGGFVCPCHDSNFAADGARLDGPSPRGMDVLATRIDDGVVLVRA